MEKIENDPEADERYLQNLCDITSSKTLTPEQQLEANNIKNYLIANYVKPSHIIHFYLYYGQAIYGQLNVFTQYHESPYAAVFDSLNQLLHYNSIDLSELLPYFKVYTWKDGLCKVDYNEDLPKNLIFIHPEKVDGDLPNIELFKSKL
jgi:hypothetical protein